MPHIIKTNLSGLLACVYVLRRFHPVRWLCLAYPVLVSLLYNQAINTGTPEVCLVPAGMADKNKLVLYHPLYKY